MTQAKHKIVVLYHDADRALAQKLIELFKAPGAVDIWTVRDIKAGKIISEEKNKALAGAARIVPFISASFLADDGMHELLEQSRKKGEQYLKPVLAGSCMYDFVSLLENIPVFTQNGNPVRSDEALSRFARQVIEEALAEPLPAADPEEVKAPPEPATPQIATPGIAALRQRWLTAGGGKAAPEAPPGISGLQARYRAAMSGQSATRAEPPAGNSPAPPARIHIVVDRNDAVDARHVDEMLKHWTMMKRQNKIEVSMTQDLSNAAAEQAAIRAADIIVFAVSPALTGNENFSALAACAQAGKKRIIPLLSQDSNIIDTSLCVYSPWPYGRDSDPLDSLSNKNKAFADISKSLGRIVDPAAARQPTPWD